MGCKLAVEMVITGHIDSYDRREMPLNALLRHEGLLDTRRT